MLLLVWQQECLAVVPLYYAPEPNLQLFSTGIGFVINITGGHSVEKIFNGFQCAEILTLNHFV